MKQIHKKIQQFTSPGTKKSYQNTIKYLMSIVKLLLNIDKNSNEKADKVKKLKNQNQEKVYSLRKFSQNYDAIQIKNDILQNDDYDQQSSQYVDTQSFKGSQISFIEDITKKDIAWQQIKIQMQKKSNKMKRELQKSIQIYHQCLSKSIEVIKQQHIKLIENYKIQQNHIKKLDLFWQNYEKRKKQCLKFSQLINITQQVLAKQFLTVIYPTLRFINPKQYKLRSQTYLLYKS